MARDKFKNNIDVEAGARLDAITRERLLALLEREGWTHAVDEDGDIVIRMKTSNTFFLWNIHDEECDDEDEDHELLSVQGSWDATFELSQLGDAVWWCNEYNGDYGLGKAYVRPDPEAGLVRLFTEFNIDYAQGITEGQLTQQVNRALIESSRFFKETTGRFAETFEKSGSRIMGDSGGVGSSQQA